MSEDQVLTRRDEYSPYDGIVNTPFFFAYTVDSFVLYVLNHFYSIYALFGLYLYILYWMCIWLKLFYFYVLTIVYCF